MSCSGISFEKRMRVYERDNFTCRVCGFQTTRERVIELTERARRNDGRIPRAELLTIDHIIPRAAGGHSRDSNLQTLCAPCNNKKGDKLPDGTRATKLKRIRKPAPPVIAMPARSRHAPGCDPVFGCVGYCAVPTSGHPVG